MGLQDDLQTLKRTWTSLSLLGKIFFGASFLCSTASVASIADVVFSFKGFIVEGTRFYHQCTAFFTNWVTNLLDIKVNQMTIDALIIVSVFCGSFLKAQKGTNPRHVIGYALAVVATYLVGMDSVSYYPVYVASVMVFFILYLKWQDGQKTIVRITLVYMGAVMLLIAIIAGLSEGLTRSVK